jgi:hypothetical protein
MIKLVNFLSVKPIATESIGVTLPLSPLPNKNVLSCRCMMCSPRKKQPLRVQA